MYVEVHIHKKEFITKIKLFFCFDSLNFSLSLLQDTDQNTEKWDRFLHYMNHDQNELFFFENTEFFFEESIIRKEKDKLLFITDPNLEISSIIDLSFSKIKKNFIPAISFIVDHIRYAKIHDQKIVRKFEGDEYNSIPKIIIKFKKEENQYRDLIDVVILQFNFGIGSVSTKILFGGQWNDEFDTLVSHFNTLHTQLTGRMITNNDMDQWDISIQNDTIKIIKENNLASVPFLTTIEMKSNDLQKMIKNCIDMYHIENEW